MCTRDLWSRHRASKHNQSPFSCSIIHSNLQSSKLYHLWHNIHNIQAIQHNQSSYNLMKLKTRVGNVSPEITKLVGIDHQAPKCTRSSPNSQGLGNMHEGRQELRIAANRASIGALDQKLSRSEVAVGGGRINTNQFFNQLFLNSLSFPSKRREENELA
ncbi:hypothetical protein PIB30_049826 [Stylosanthes scabra]|uniref:Uncharacterized protein n=1 Tax=Stylosanthes scabra TaxID=79078 RepID=A0ABU6WJ36_9FABA|nr:hypothetical protein [Stylosanthes scabra]